MWSPVRRVRANPPGAMPPPHVSASLLVAGLAVRAVFIACLLAITILVSMPQNETIWTVYETPADSVRVALGLAVCVWVAVALVRAPKDARSCRTWLYLGLAGIPLALVCLFALW